MPKPASQTVALPIAHVVLRILVVLNWLSGAVVLTLLVFLPNARWILSALDLTPSPEADRVIFRLRMIALCGLVAVALTLLVLRQLIAMVATVRAGDPFVASNAKRLKTIAWLLLGLQLISMVIGGIADSVSTPAHPVDLDAGFSVNGWLAVLLTFLLAQVFEVGARMRDDLEGTV